LLPEIYRFWQISDFGNALLLKIQGLQNVSVLEPRGDICISARALVSAVQAAVANPRTGGRVVDGAHGFASQNLLTSEACALHRPMRPNAG
jgi:hypothetical protein